MTDVAGCDPDTIGASLLPWESLPAVSPAWVGPSWEAEGPVPWPPQEEGTASLCAFSPADDGLEELREPLETTVLYPSHPACFPAIPAAEHRMADREPARTGGEQMLRCGVGYETVLSIVAAWLVQWASSVC